MIHGREVAILGIGMHPWGMFPDKDDAELGSIAIREALKDANLDWKDIQFMGAGVDVWRGKAGLYAGNEIALRFGETGIPIVNINNACATGVFVLKVVCDQVRLGNADLAIAVGSGKSPGGFFPFLEAATPYQPDMDTLRWRVGLPNPAYWAMYMMRRIHNYGDTEEMLARIKVKSSKAGAVNPNARYRRAFTREQVLASPMVCSPLRLYEICATSQGAAAIILCSLDYARKHTTKPIILASAATGSPLYGDSTLRLVTISSSAKETAPYFSEAVTASRRAYAEADMTPQDIDIAEIPDNSSWHEMEYMEINGFAKPGEAGHLVMEGYTDVNGKLPLNMSGGMASFGEVTTGQGMQQVHDTVLQFRGTAPYPVPKKLKTAFCQTYGGFGNNSVAILKR